MAQELPAKDKIFEGINKASQLIEVGLTQGKEPFVRLAQDVKMKPALDTIAAAIQKELEQPRLAKEAIDAAAHLMEERQNKFVTMDVKTMKQGLEASAQMVENYKQSHVERLQQERRQRSQGQQKGPSIT